MPRLMSAGAAALAACSGLAIAAGPPDTAAAPTIMENAVAPAATSAPDDTTATAPALSSTLAVEADCVQLLTPRDAAKYYPIGMASFSWSGLPGAASYRLELTPSGRQPVSFNTAGLGRDQYLEAFKTTGKFEWRVAAIDASGGVMCESATRTFVKMDTGSSDPSPGPNPSYPDSGGG